MFALIALALFALQLFHVRIGDIDLVVCGFVCLAAHLAFGGGFYPVFRPDRG